MKDKPQMQIYSTNIIYCEGRLIVFRRATDVNFNCHVLSSCLSPYAQEAYFYNLEKNILF